MNDAREIRFLFRLVLRGWWILLPALVICGGLGAWVVYRATPTYQASATLKINDKESGASAFMKNFERFSTTGALLTEVEVLKSRYLINQTLNRLDFDRCYYRYVRGTRREVYQRSPLLVDLVLRDSSWVNVPFDMTWSADSSLTLTYPGQPAGVVWRTRLGEPLETPGFTATFSLNHAYLAQEPEALQPGVYGFEQFGRERLVAQYAGSDLVVKLLDQEVAIVKLYFHHKVPLKAQLFLNTLAQTYIDDFIANKTEAAAKALAFIDAELAKVSRDLTAAEAALQAYKAREGITELDKDTEAEMKQLRELEMQRVALELEAAEGARALRYLEGEVWRDETYPEAAPYADPVLTGLWQQIQTLRQERRELLQRYTTSHPTVLVLDSNLKDLHHALVQTLSQQLQSRQARQAELNRNIVAARAKLEAFPAVERELLVLERDFISRQQAYNFLLEKRTEAAIGAASTIAFHKILEPATLPAGPINSQKKIILGVSIFLGLILALVIIFFRHYLAPAVFDPAELQEKTGLAVVGSIPWLRPVARRAWINLATSLQLQHPGAVACLAHCRPGPEGGQAAWALAQAWHALGLRVLLVDARPGTEAGPGFHAWLASPAETPAPVEVQPGHPDYLPAGPGAQPGLFLQSALPARLHALAEGYDRLLLISPALDPSREGLSLMAAAHLNLLLVTEARTRLHALQAQQALWAGLDLAAPCAIWLRRRRSWRAFIPPFRA